MGNSRKPNMRSILVVTLICLVLFSTNCIQLGKSDSPFIQINGGASYTESPSVTLALSSPDLAFYMRFSNDDVSWSENDWEPYSSSKAWTLTSGDGDKTVFVQFKDLFGVISGASDTIILDTMAPSLTISSPTTGSWFKSSSVPVSGTSSDSGSGISMVEYQVDRGAWSPATGTDTWSFTAGSLTQDSHTIYVRATDNVEKTTTLSVVVNIDTVAPFSSVSTLSNYQTGTSFAVSYSSSDADSGIANVTLWVKTPGSGSYSDRGVWNSGASYTANAGDGLYTFYTIATDNAGNSETAPNSADTSTTVDTLAPTGSIVINNGASYTTSTSVTLTLSASSDTQYMKFSTNGGSKWTDYEAYSTPKPFTLLSGDGVKTVLVMFKDNAGLESTETISDSITLDTSAPITTISLAGTPLTGETAWYTGKVTVSLSSVDTGSGVFRRYYSLDGGTNYQPYTTPFDITAQGTTTIYYYSTDNAGHTETP